MNIKLKICGMKQAANIAEVADLQPDYMGFIFYAKSPRVVSEITSELIKYIPASIKTTGVFVNEAIEKVKAAVLKFNLKAVQLHGSESPAFCAEISSMGCEVIKAFGVDEQFDFEQLKNYETVIDYFLFDTQTLAHGGSGKVFDWNLLTHYQLQKAYFLSGGIDLSHLETIKNINDPRLYAVDINSRFELEPGFKDVEKLKGFVSLLKQ